MDTLLENAAAFSACRKMLLIDIIKCFNRIKHCESVAPFVESVMAKDKTGGSRPASRHTFARQQKYAKVPSPAEGITLLLLPGVKG